MCSRLYNIIRYAFLLTLALPASAGSASAQIDFDWGVYPGEYQGGRRYILAFPDTIRNQFDLRFTPMIQDKFQVMVYSHTDGNHIVLRAATGEIVNKTLRRETFEVIDIRENPVVSFTGVVNSHTFLLTADQPVIVYCYFATKFGAEAWAPLPVEAWGKEYRIAARSPETVADVKPSPWNVTYDERPAPAEAVILAAYDSTHVTITDAAGAVAFKITMWTGGAYQIRTGQGPGTITDLAGARITADMPIGVISGNTRARVVDREYDGVTGNSARNAMLEWLTPIEQHGARFVYLPTWDGNRAPDSGPNEESRQAEHVRIYGTTQGATTVNSSSTVLQGRFHEDTVSIPKARYYVTDKPAQAMMNSSPAIHYYKSQDGSSYLPRIDVRAASYMVEMVPREQWVNFAPFHVPTHPTNMEHFVNVVTDPGATEIETPIVLRTESGGVRSETLFKFNRGAIPGTDLRWGTMQLVPGATYTLIALDSTLRFSGFVYGTWAGYELARPSSIAEYEENIALAYGYPLAPNRRTVVKAYPPLDIDTSWLCSDLTIRVRYIGEAQAGIRSIYFEGAPTNARLVNVAPLAGLVPGDLTATVRIVPIDPRKDAEGVVKAVDRAGRISLIPYRYTAERVYINPEGSLNFGEVDVSKPLDDRIVSIYNATDRPVTITAIRLSKSPSGFTLKSPTLPLTVAPGTSIGAHVGIRNPTVLDTIYEDSLIVATDCNLFGIKLRAETMSPCLSVGDLDFGLFDLSDPASAQGRTKLLEICNKGRGLITFFNNGNSVITWLLKNFKVEPGHLAMLKSASLGPNQCVTIEVRFVPTGTGTFSTVARLFADTRVCRDTSVWKAEVIRSTSTSAPTTGAAGYEISAAAPNPFTSEIDIVFSLGATGHVGVEIFDETGRHAATLLQRVLEAGTHRVRWNAENNPPGVYYCRVTSGSWSASATLTLVR